MNVRVNVNKKSKKKIGSVPPKLNKYCTVYVTNIMQAHYFLFIYRKTCHVQEVSNFVKVIIRFLTNRQ
jgi:hypothetical protein